MTSSYPKHQLDMRRVRVLFETNSAMFVGVFICVLAYVYVTRNSVPHQSMWLWLAYMCSAFAFRFALQKRFKRISRNAAPFDAHKFERLHAIGLFLSASGWGLAGSVILPQQHELVLVLGLINVGLIAGGASAYAVSRASTFAVMFPMSIPLAIATFASGNEVLMAMGFMVALFAAIMARAAVKRRDFVLQAWRLADEKEILSQQLLETQAKATQSAKMAALGQMAAGIAHEINTPLAIIGVCAQTIQEMSEEEAPNLTSLRDYANQIDSTALRIAKIVGGLKNFARSGQNDSAQTIEVTNLIQDTLAFCHERLKRFGIQMRVEEIPEAQLVGHPAQLSQVLLNLLNNAADAVEGQQEKWISIACERRTDTLVIRVCDSGAGVPNEIRSKLMEPFFTTKDFGKGTGLGLSVAHGIAVAHGGSLILDETSFNTAFVLSLPLRSSAQESLKSA